MTLKRSNENRHPYRGYVKYYKSIEGEIINYFQVNDGNIAIAHLIENEKGIVTSKMTEFVFTPTEIDEEEYRAVFERIDVAGGRPQARKITKGKSI